MCKNAARRSMYVAPGWIRRRRPGNRSVPTLHARSRRMPHCKRSRLERQHLHFQSQPVHRGARNDRTMRKGELGLHLSADLSMHEGQRRPSVLSANILEPMLRWVRRMLPRRQMPRTGQMRGRRDRHSLQCIHRQGDIKKCTKSSKGDLFYVSAGSRACPNGCTPDGTKCAE